MANKRHYAGEIFAAIQNWWKEGDSPLHFGALLLDDDTPIGEAVRQANTISLATAEEIAKAREMYQTTEIEIDDNDVRASTGEDGTWVSAWVFIPITEEPNPNDLPERVRDRLVGF